MTHHLRRGRTQPTVLWAYLVILSSFAAIAIALILVGVPALVALPVTIGLGGAAVTVLHRLAQTAGPHDDAE